MLVTNLNANSADPGQEPALRPSAPPPPVGDPRRDDRARSGHGTDPAEDERETGREGGPPDPPSAPADSTQVGASQAQALVAALGEERVRLAYDNQLSRLFVELLDPRTGDVITRFPPERLVEQLDRLAADARPGSEDDATPAAGLSGILGAGTGRVLDELV